MNKTCPIEYLVRPVKEPELPFVFNSFLKSLWHSKGIWSAVADKKRFFSYFHEWMETRVFDTRLLVACSVSDQDNLFGWIAAGPESSVDYAYVKANWRGFGIGYTLLQQAAKLEQNVLVSAHTVAGLAWLRAYGYSPVYHLGRIMELSVAC